ncbi:MAG: GNAT family N-acetyltransferase [Deltaproteobacteria bacterium]|nr:GNAT family N-acetyltransferase [Deltaproteobacteria bacterium]
MPDILRAERGYPGKGAKHRKEKMLIKTGKVQRAIVSQWRLYMFKEVLIRTAKPADAEAIIQAHYAAVHETASAFYPPEIIEDWSRKPDEARYQWMRQIITQGNEVVIVAEDESGILGFGLMIPQLRELRALYVHPTAGRRGIGQRILQELETRAVMQGIPCLQLNASLNAEAFYLRNGYKTLSPGTLRLSTEHEMDCIKMEKHL